MTTHKLVTYRVRKTDADKARALVAAYADEVGRKEGGTGKFEVWQDAADPARFTTHVVFNAPAGEKYHTSTPWAKKFQDAMAPLYEAPPETRDVRTVP